MGENIITLIGGDQRSLALANLLLDEGKKVVLHGFDRDRLSEGMEACGHLGEAIGLSKLLIGPLPFARDKYLNTPLYTGKIYVEDIFKNMGKDQVLFAGMVSDEWYDIAYEYNINMVDYFHREEVQILNAIATSEGAIQIAMEKMETTIHNSNVMVLGFGRIGKRLAKSLEGIGANLYIGARSLVDISWIRSYGYKPVLLKEIRDYLPSMDLIINTIPSLMLDSPSLAKIKKGALIIDLASRPGGIDFKAAEKLKIDCIWALGLPGKVAPIAAGGYIKEAIYNLINEMEV